jgi:tRNA A-37 threonylcarbamoyl transferase component Bud32/CheY-like chemotaxis protein
MIIDGHPEFRTLLMHHITTVWHDAVISQYDPHVSGALPDTFGGADQDLILIGHRLGSMDGLEALKVWCRGPSFPPAIFFTATRDPAAGARALQYGAHTFFHKSEIGHAALIGAIRKALGARRSLASTDSLFFGEAGRSRPGARGYRLKRRLAAGDGSSVYLTEHESTGREVVLKILREVPDAIDDDSDALSRFLREFEVIAELDNPNIVRIDDLGIGDDHAYIAMEYFPGGDLRGRIQAGMGAEEALDVLNQIAGALKAIHSVGILHRDLKPANIMLREDGSIALIDFGLAKRARLEAEVTGEGEIFGTPYYMSPEQGHGRLADQRSDLYSLGVILYEMLTREKPFVADSAMGIIYRHGHAPIPRLPAPVDWLQPLLDGLLAKDPADRFQNADEVLSWRR